MEGHAVSYRAVFGVREFQALFAAYTVSVAGDQLARVALSILVYDRTGSPAWTALTYALTFLPDLIGGPLLSGLADRYPRRAVMIVCDAARAGLVALMAVPNMPLLLVVALLVAVQLVGSPATAARGSLLPQVLGEDAYPAGQAAMQTVFQIALVIGFVGGGGLVATMGTSGALLVDAATFVFAAGIVWWRVRPRPAAAGDQEVVKRGWWSDVVAGAGLVWGDLKLRALVAFACVSGFYVTGEALATPYAKGLGGGPLAVGLLFASYAVGSAAGMLALGRLDKPLRLRMMPPMAVASCLPLVVCFVNPPLPVVAALFVLSGLGASYNLVASTTFVLAVPDDRRGQAFGLAVTALRVAQGLGVALAGLAAEYARPHLVLGVIGTLGVLFALGVWQTWRRANA
ncbi:MFS transporter [Tenggerimyces flavus]|uniref:MFS transporter n=1 Tax=Tenggerimyces flavus TaxID=1708749 RepID=A0ABV7Y5K6_9ACTN|nr:MFS transporter [Tenggerimyces flavus]MBM7788358.1 putative MFS family arabinose efflux permease [Tenggerimyces flavus]